MTAAAAVGVRSRAGWGFPIALKCVGMMCMVWSDLSLAALHVAATDIFEHTYLLSLQQF